MGVDGVELSEEERKRWGEWRGMKWTVLNMYALTHPISRYINPCIVRCLRLHCFVSHLSDFVSSHLQPRYGNRRANSCVLHFFDAGNKSCGTTSGCKRNVKLTLVMIESQNLFLCVTIADSCTLGTSQHIRALARIPKIGSIQDGWSDVQIRVGRIKKCLLLPG